MSVMVPLKWTYLDCSISSVAEYDLITVKDYMQYQLGWP